MSQTSATEKLYCYVDETGQDTKGQTFIVSVAIVSDDSQREAALQRCMTIEHDTGKGRRKWTKTRPQQRVSYIQNILAESLFQGDLFFSVYSGSTDYLPLTTHTIALAVQSHTHRDYKLTVLFDGLPKSLQRKVGGLLRREGVSIRKVRGVNEENDALSRLADAICGFVRAGLEGKAPYAAMLEDALRQGYIAQVGQK